MLCDAIRVIERVRYGFQGISLCILLVTSAFRTRCSVHSQVCRAPVSCHECLAVDKADSMRPQQTVARVYLTFRTFTLHLRCR